MFFNPAVGGMLVFSANRFALGKNRHCKDNYLNYTLAHGSISLTINSSTSSQ